MQHSGANSRLQTRNGSWDFDVLWRSIGRKDCLAIARNLAPRNLRCCRRRLSGEDVARSESVTCSLTARLLSRGRPTERSADLHEGS
jgi:hypothetical protein